MTGLELLLMDLESNRLEVQLVPLNPRLRNWNEHGCKRVLTGKSPRWYANLCAAHPSSRGVRRGKFDTKIRRQNIERILRRMVAGQSTCSKYAAEIRSAAERRAA